MKFALPTFIFIILGMVLFAGCGNQGSKGVQAFEQGMPVVLGSDLKVVGGTPVDFPGAPADVYEGDINIWFYESQPFTGWSIMKYENGNLERKEFLQTGLQHGLAQFWYVDGQLRAENNWHYGVPDGLEVLWHENGKVHAINYWQRGIVLIKRVWDKSGSELKVEGWNEDGTPIATSGK